jgi:hypothetical protein
MDRTYVCPRGPLCNVIGCTLDHPEPSDRDVRLLDLAIKRDDRLAIATIETRLGFGYADRFIREA